MQVMAAHTEAEIETAAACMEAGQRFAALALQEMAGPALEAAPAMALAG